MPKAKAPVQQITSINSLKPSRNKNNGKKQAINHDKLRDKPKSYHKTFFKVKPNVIKEVKQVITPKINPKITMPLPKILAKPEIASLEVEAPETPKTIKAKKR